jgi:hypothetical protein
MSDKTMSETSGTRFLQATYIPLILHSLALVGIVGVIVWIRRSYKPTTVTAESKKSQVFSITNKCLFSHSYTSTDDPEKMDIWFHSEATPAIHKEIDRQMPKITDNPLPYTLMAIFWTVVTQPLITIIAVSIDKQKTSHYNADLAMAIIALLISLVNAVLIPVLIDALRRKFIVQWSLKSTTLAISYSSDIFKLYKIEAFRK